MSVSTAQQPPEPAALLRRGRAVALWATPLVLALVAYHPIVGCYFNADDFLHLQQIVNDPLPRFVFAPFGGHAYIVRNAVFYALFAVFGPEPSHFFQVVLLTHLVNVGLLFALLRRLCGDRLACFGAAVWGVAPMHEGALGWYSAHGMVVATGLILVVLLDVARAREAAGPITVGRAVVWSALLLAACNGYGTAMGMGAAFPVAAWLLLPARRMERGAWLALAALVVVVPGGYLLLQTAYRSAYAAEGDLSDLGAYTGAFMHGWKASLGMLAYLPGAGASALLLGWLRPIPSYPSLPQVAAALVLAIAIAYVILAGGSDVRRWLLALAVLTLASYATVAAGRGPMFGALPDYGSAQTRYHYLPSMALTVMTCIVLGWLAARLAVSSRVQAGLLPAAVAMLAILAHRNASGIDHHDLARARTTETLGHVRTAIASIPTGWPVYIRNRGFPPAVIPAFAGTAALYAVFNPSDARPVFFVDPNPSARRLPPGSRIAGLLVTPDAVPPWARPMIR